MALAHFLGVGSANQVDLGHASMVLEVDEQPLLLVDCGPGTLAKYQDRYQSLPEHVFVTHLHFDHIGDLEALFYRAAFSRDTKPRVFVPSTLVDRLTRILSNTGLAEGGMNLWQGLQVVPVIEDFWLGNLQFKLYPVRHHVPSSAYALHLPGWFFYTGDTRPIPELLHHMATQDEVIFHDCALEGNPSHTGATDLTREYQQEVLARMWLYHYGSRGDGIELENRGFRVLTSGQSVNLNRTRSFRSNIKKLNNISA